MKYGIASYQRPECKTIKMLFDEGVSGEEIIISTQTQEDFKTYKEMWGGAE